MRKFYIGNVEITEKEAMEIEKQNQKYLASSDMNNLFKIRFIVATHTK